MGAVTDESGRTNLPSTVALEGGNVTTGAAAMPKLVAAEANNTLNQVTYRFDRNLDTEAAQAAQLGFYTLDGRAVTAASIVSGDSNQVIAQFDRQVQDAVRYFAEAGAVTDSRGPVADVTAANFTVYTPDGAEIPGASAVQPAPNVVRVAFPAIEKYGQTVTVAAVKPDAVKSNDGSATANTVGLRSIGEAAGLTSGPDLQSVTIEPSTGQVRYIFDKVLDDDNTYDPANFAVITAAGDIIPARSFVEVEGNSVLLNFNTAAAHAAHAVTLTANAVQDFQGNANPVGDHHSVTDRFSERPLLRRALGPAEHLVTRERLRSLHESPARARRDTLDRPRGKWSHRAMARYDYVCGECGVFEVVRPIDAPVCEQTCAMCGGRARRVYASPAITSPRSALRRMRDAAERSAHEPAVRHSLPAPPRRSVRPPNPLHARLPKP